MTGLRRAGLLVAFSLVCINSCFADGSTFVPQERSDPRAAARHQKLKSMVTKHDADVVMIGDSIVQQWRSEAAAKTFGTPFVLNLGVGGDKTQNVLWRMNDMPLHEIFPKIVVILVGANNLIAGYAPADIALGVEEIAKKAKQTWPSADLRVVNILPQGDAFDFREQDRENANELLGNAAVHIGYRLVNTDDFGLTCNHSAPCANYRPDNLHLSPAGYELIAKAVQRKP